MKKSGPRYRVQFRRKREGRTDYRLRLRLLMSGKPRFVPRISLKHVSAQVIESTEKGDKILASAHSKQLVKMGWKGGCSNMPSAYLVGLLCGYRAMKAGVRSCVLDSGVTRPAGRSTIFSVLKGALDAGLEIPHGDITPDEDRISGKHISEHARGLREKDPGSYEKRFSEYIKRGLNPEDLPEHFNAIKQEIVKQFQ
ncbi:MAG: 50S ribosomal protein L18 [Candidatus Hadarchaeales archaeon]